MSEFKTNAVVPVANQFVEDRFGITNAVAADIAVIPLSDGSAIVLYKGTSINTANYANILSGVIVDLAAGKIYTREVGGAWTGITYTAA